MEQRFSRALFAAEFVLLGLPTLLFVLPSTVPGALVLTPIAVGGLVKVFLEGGPGLAGDLGTGLGLLGMALLNVCSMAAIVNLLRLAGVFLLQGRCGLARRARTLRHAVLWAAPPLLCWSIPQIYATLHPPITGDGVIATTLQSGAPLVIPALHLAVECRAARTKAVMDDAASTARSQQGGAIDPSQGEASPPRRSGGSDRKWFVAGSRQSRPHRSRDRHG